MVLSADAVADGLGVQAQRISLQMPHRTKFSILVQNRIANDSESDEGRRNVFGTGVGG